MSLPSEIPLSPTPQRFAITLGARQYRLSLRYLDTQEGGWLLDIADLSDTPILRGLPLVTGHDLLEQYASLDLGGTLTLATDADSDAVPSFETLGTASHLYFTAA